MVRTLRIEPGAEAQGPIVSKGGWGAPQSYHFAAWLIRLR